MDSRITLYPFRKRDELTGKWYRARWKASLEEIAKLGGVVDGERRYARETIGAPGSLRTAIRPSR